MRKLVCVVAVVLMSIVVSLGGTAPTKSSAPSSGAQPAAAVANADQGAVVLPVKRVVLYKNGVGYFEHSGHVRGSQDLSIEFTTAQLNDVLKSLTAVDLGGGHITGVRYNSIAPLSERLKTLQISLGEDVTSAAFLNAIRGTRVEVRSGGAAVLGKVLSVETVKKETVKGGTVDITQLSVIADTGELRSFEMGPATSVRMVDGEIRQDVGRYLNLVGSTRSKDVRRMTISAAGTGERELFVSYISEVPVWKSTYRIVIPKAPGTPFIQGWAIVDNTVGEDWKDVQLSLVSGAPQSFIQNISQPYYTRRPVVALPQSVMLTPQEHEASLEERQFDKLESFAKLQRAPGGMPDGVPGGQMSGVIGGLVATSPAPAPPMAKAAGPGMGRGIAGGVFGPGSLNGLVTDPSGAVVPNASVTVRNRTTGRSQTTRTNTNGQYSFRYVEPGNAALSVDSPGFRTSVTEFYADQARGNRVDATLNVGSVAETVEVADMNTSMAVEAAMRDQMSGAEGGKLGELFQYAVKQKITVLKNQSALVPIVQSPIQAERVTLITAGEAGEIAGAPLRALWLKNTSGLMLDGGTFNILEEDSFAGEGVTSVLHPDERRLLSYAADTAIHVKSTDDFESGIRTHVKIVKGLMEMTREERSTRKYEVRNADITSREVVIEHPIRENFKLVDGLNPEESSANHHRFRMKIEPGKTETLLVKEYRPEVSNIYLTNISDSQVDYFRQQKMTSPALEDAFHRVLTKKNEIGAVDNDLRLREQELASIDRDQARVRENMKALKGSAEEKALLQRYTRQLDSQEDRISTLRSEMSGLKDKRAKLQAELDTLVQEIALDETI